MKRLLAGAAVVVAVLLATAGPAAAHAQLQSTDPPAGAVLAKAPEHVVLHFGEPVEIQFGAVRVYDASAKRVDSGSSFHPNGDSHAVATKLPANLAAGGYVVTWRVISADSHPVHGAFTFRVGTGAASASSLKDEAAKLLSATGGSLAVGAIFAVVRSLGFAGLLVFAGAVAFIAWGWRAGEAEPRARQLVWASWFVLVVATAAGFALQGPYGGGLPLSNAFKPSVLSAVWHTRFGHVYALRLALLAVAGLLVWLKFVRHAYGRWWSASAAATGCVLLVTPGLAGHAGVGSQVPLALAMDFLHVGAAAVWLGGLTVLGVAVLSRRGVDPSDPQDALLVAPPLFSQWAFAAMVVIVGTGVYAAWRQVGTLSAVTSTTYGRLLLAKTLAVVVLIALASVSRRAVHGRLALPLTPPTRRPVRTPAAVSSGPGAMAARGRRRARQLRQAVLAELVIAVFVLAVTALLVNAQPARAALSRPFSTEVKAGNQLLVDVVVDPAKAGPLAVHLYVLTPDGAQVDVPQVTATMSMPRAGIDQIAVPLAKAGVGHFAAYGFEVPIRGSWTLSITIRTSDIDEVAASPIRVPIH